MLIDLLSNSNQITFNSMVANVFGLHTAVYLAEIMAINEKAVRKGKTTNIDGLIYFKIERKYIEGRITLTSKEQLEIDEKLSNLNIIKINDADKNSICLDINRLANLLDSDIKEELIKEESKSKTKKSNKKEESHKAHLDYLISTGKSFIHTNDVFLRPELEKWVEGYVMRYEKQLTHSIVKGVEDELLAFSHGDTMIAAEVAKYNYEGYNTMQYAIDKYKSQGPKNKIVNNNQTVSRKIIKNEDLI